MHKHHAHVRLFVTLLTLFIFGVVLYVVLLYLNAHEIAIANPLLPKAAMVLARPAGTTTPPLLIEVTGSSTPVEATATSPGSPVIRKDPFAPRVMP